jgi:hypothetical protein
MTAVLEVTPRKMAARFNGGRRSERNDAGVRHLRSWSLVGAPVAVTKTHAVTPDHGDMSDNLACLQAGCLMGDPQRASLVGIDDDTIELASWDHIPAGLI